MPRVHRLRKILIANRGEIALRIMRTCRGMGIATVAIYADPDRDAPFVRAADEAVYIGPPIASGSFLAIEKIIDAARRLQADAVHPGYGFLAENADFAEACAAADLVFIGPTPDAIRRMGSKIEAKKIAAAAGVPSIPGFSAAGLSDRQIGTEARRLDGPVLVKASAGGGGKGMRVVRDLSQLGDALASARREAKSAFGDDTLLIERYFEAPRHIEMQILGDAHGNLLHCFERECSIQRRYQKIIEEAPSPAVDDALRARMSAAAVTLARVLHYRNAGTVEFIVDQDGLFYLLEVNTRLQVEHPVTEAITGLDLVEWQIRIAQGERLPFTQADLRADGHAIECRLYAEDPAADFLPSTGRVTRFETPPLAGLRYDSGIESGSTVTIHYDPMLAKIIAHAPTRAEAIQRMQRALHGTRVHGVRTNLPLLRAIMRHPAFAAGALDTHFIERHVPLAGLTAAQEGVDAIHAVGAALWLQRRRRAEAVVLGTLPSGWRNNPTQMQEQAFTAGDTTWRVRYRVHSPEHIDVDVNGRSEVVVMVPAEGAAIALVIDGVRRTYNVECDDEVCAVHSVLGTSELRLVPRFPLPQRVHVAGGCEAPMPGKILTVRVGPGQPVRKGDVLVILEAMKMEHNVVAPHDGVVREVRVEVGQQVDAGTVLIVLDESAPSDAPADGR